MHEIYLSMIEHIYYCLY